MSPRYYVTFVQAGVIKFDPEGTQLRKHTLPTPVLTLSLWKDFPRSTRFLETQLPRSPRCGGEGNCQRDRGGGGGGGGSVTTQVTKLLKMMR